MTKHIAVCGKGGVGKTTVVCGITKYLIENNQTPILVVDADPNSNLAENLGVKYDITIADVREELRTEKVPQYMSKSDYINMRLQETIVEHSGFDLLVMGHPEGRECYCFVNELLRNFLSQVAKNYKYVVIDTEAGMEHFSRRTVDNIDCLFIITIPTKVAFDTAKKIISLIPKLKLKIFDTKIIVNMVNQEKYKIDFEDLPIAGFLHVDKEVESFSQNAVPLLPNLQTTKFYSELTSILKNFV